MPKNSGLMIIFLVTLALVAAVSTITFLPFDIREGLIHHFRPVHPVTSSSDGATSSTSSVSSDVIITSPQDGATVSSPLTIAGEAPGAWYFEASFPIKIIDAKGNVIGQGPAEAGADWMTTDLVPFTSTIEFSPQASGTKGTIVFMNDDPSGDPSRDASTTLSIQF